MKKTIIFLISALLLTPVTTFAGEYIGNYSSNPYAPNSTSNPYGSGSPYDANSVNNSYGKYGSPTAHNQQIIHTQPTPLSFMTVRVIIEAS